MNKVESLHNESMEFIDKALLYKQKGDELNYIIFMKKAFHKEKEAALDLSIEKNLEPTRSILLRSAASIAIQCNEYREAERLIAEGLSGSPHEDIAEELRNLMQITIFKRHLEEKGITLNQNEFELELAGNEVGVGFVNSSNFIERIKYIQSLLKRTAQRIAGDPFQLYGRMPEVLPLYMSQPRAGSFSVTFRLGHLSQLSLPSDLAPQVIAEFLECIDLFSKNDKVLIERISSPQYYRNFIELIKKISPDGQKISHVGFTSTINKKPKHVELKLPKSEYFIGVEEEAKSVHIQGTVDFADATKKKIAKIKIIDKNSKHHIINVPPEMMDDIVRPLWGMEVKIKGIKKRREIELKDIDKIEE